MGLTHTKQGDCKTQRSRQIPEAGRQGFEPGTYRTVSGTSGLIEPKKLPNPVKESKNHRDLHRELLFSHKRREADVRDRRQSQLRGGSFAESQAEAFCASYNGSLPSSLERQKTKLIDYIGLCQHRCMEWQPGGPATQQI
ncbi:protein FAM107B-like [Alligator mississippiensis]|uniref:Protein FAM107B-like n=1 Tax=Alligator mississippiensis TaxID=8496 RepID=A0A151N8U0_ALLMI|nr:protein FAM107B-like [Alligator mississippiensis]